MDNNINIIRNSIVDNLLVESHEFTIRYTQNFGFEFIVIYQKTKDNKFYSFYHWYFKNENLELGHIDDSNNNIFNMPKIIREISSFFKNLKEKKLAFWLH